LRWDGFCASFNGRMRDEVPNENVFFGLEMPSASCFSTAAFCASENSDSSKAFRSSQPKESGTENSSSKRLSLPGQISRGASERRQFMRQIGCFRTKLLLQHIKLCN
jgi:hypothetical protein